MKRLFGLVLIWLVYCGAGWGQISVTLHSPNGGEQWEAGSARNITWETTGSPSGINIYYSIDAGVSWSNIASGAPDNGSLSWTVYSLVTTEALVSIEAVKAGEVVTAESASYFSIVDTTAPAVTVETPNGGDAWRGGTAHNISFEATDLFGIQANSLAIWYSVDNGSTYTDQVTADAAVSSPYRWTLPSLSTTEARVRVAVRDGNSLSGTDESNAKFTIDSTAPGVTLTRPNSGLLTGDATAVIAWAVTDECGLPARPINLYYSTNSGSTWTLITNETNSGSYNWTVPHLNTTTARVSVEAVNLVGLVASAMSSSDLTICSDFQGPAVTVTSPAATDAWLGGSTHNIVFTASDATGIKANSLAIWYSTDNGLTYANQITHDANTASPYSWTLPAGLSTTEVKVRVSLTDSSPVENVGTGTSDAFTIDSTAPAVTVIQPNGRESLSGDNATYEVRWVATEECGLPARPINIYYSTNSGSTWTLITNETNSGTYTWTVPHINTATARISVEAVNLVGLTGRDQSDADFSITSDVTGPTVTVSVPAAGAKWKGGSSQQISFTASDPSGMNTGKYSIYYYNGSSWTAIVTDQTLVSPYSWNPVASINTQSAKIRVTARDIYDNLGTGESGAFTIDSDPPAATLTSPTGGVSWEGGVSHNVTWTATDNFGLMANPVSLQYSSDGGGTWTNIAAGQPNTSPYAWPVPSDNTNQARVRIIVTDEAGNNYTNTSTNFIIDSTAPGTPSPLTQLNNSATNDATPYFSWSAPTDNLSGIASYEIMIDTTVVTQGATASYTQPGGSPLPDGFHTWEVRARDWAGNWGAYCTAQTFDVITSAPSISGITLKDTTTGSTLYAKSRLVSLEASGVGAKAFQLISSESASFSGGAWQTYINPTNFQLSSNQGSKTVYYKVRDTAYNESTFESTGITLDTYVPSVSVISPNGGESLGGGLNYTISWNASDVGVGLAANPITIRYSSNGGTTWAMVISHEATGASSGTYNWVVPSGIDSSTCRISIEAVDLAGNIQAMQSSANFTIVAAGPAVPSVTAPANNGYVSTNRPLLQWSAVSSAVSYECLLDTDAADLTGTNSYQPDYSLTDGVHQFRVRARNAADLWSPTSETVTFTVDTAGPVVSFNSFTDSGNPQPTFRGTLTDNFKIVSAEIRLDGGAWQSAAAADGSFDSTSEAFSFETPGLLTKGSHSVEARAFDAAGNSNDPPARLNFAITKSAVSFDVKMGTAAVSTGTIIPYRPTFTVVLAAAQPVVDFKVYIDNQSVYAHTGSFTQETVSISPFQDLAVGSHVLKMVTQSAAGDVSTSEITGLTVISDVRVFMTAAASTITLAVSTSSSGPATLIIRKPNGQTILQKSIPDIGESTEITINKYIVGENLKGPYLWKIIYNSGRSYKSGGFIVP